MKTKALFLFFISSLLTSSWTDDQHLLVETVDEKDTSDASTPPEESNPNTKTNTKSEAPLPPQDSSPSSDYRSSGGHGMSIAEILGVQNSGLWWVKKNLVETPKMGRGSFDRACRKKNQHGAPCTTWVKRKSLKTLFINQGHLSYQGLRWRSCLKCNRQKNRWFHDVPDCILPSILFVQGPPVQVCWKVLRRTLWKDQDLDQVQFLNILTFCNRSARKVYTNCVESLVRSHDLLVLLLAKDHLRPLKFISLVFTEVSMFCDSLLSTVKNYPRYNYCVLVLWMSRLSRFLIAGTAAGSPLTTWDTNPVRHIYYYLPTMLSAFVK